MRHRGFTLVELLVALVVLSLVATGLSKIFLTQQRLTVSQVEQASLQSNVRTGSLVLSNELREIASDTSGASDIVSFSPTALTYRAMRSLGLACQVSETEVRLLATPLYGARPIQVTDSMLLYVEGDPNVSTDDHWLALDIRGIHSTTCGASAAIGLSTWIDTTANPLGDILLEAPVRTFEIMQLAPVAAGGQTWLGAASLSQGQVLTPVAGPLTVNGLGFTYLDSLGNVTATRSRIRSIQIALRGQTDRAVRTASDMSVLAPSQDSLVTTITLRNTPEP
ncbi:MAG TPA: prepilin-type N-terminal cleavage/methylation domain-containing protein [Gemmatimonadales bacterium]|nr:prepilin-type N-terminal cleavage/methylation domain-containing protein [Gemmatimonadales bacterium]